MRCLFTGLMVVAITALMPMLAMAGNQETANQIAKSLKDSGKLDGYRIGVRFQNGTTWLTGTVQSREQMAIALRLVSASEGVSRVINNLEIQATAGPKPDAPLTRFIAKRSTASPLASPRQSLTTAERLARVRASQKEALAAQKAMAQKAAAQKAMAQRTVAYEAEQVPTSYPTGAVQRVAGTEYPAQAAPRMVATRPMGRPIPIAYMQQGRPMPAPRSAGRPIPAYVQGGGGPAPARYDQPHLPNYAWPSYSAHPNYAALTYPRQYSPAAWPYIGPFYPYPQVPLGWRKVTLEWDDGWWMLDFKDR